MSSTDSGSAPNLLFYCHEGLGLGHLRRILTLGQYFEMEWPGLNQLIVTSTAAAGVVVPTERIDYVKLPAVRRVRPEEHEAPFEARSLRLPFQRVWSMRRDLLLSVVHNYQPDALIVDYMPAGLKGELAPALRYLKANAGTRFVLGLRDILDEGQRVRRPGDRTGSTSCSTRSTN